MHFATINMNESNIDNIRRLLDSDRVADAIAELEAHLSAYSVDDEAYYLLGNAYCRLSDWKHAIESYKAAIALNPESPAVEADKKIQEILNFYCHDLFNP